jgi:hypothetical protein
MTIKDKKKSLNKFEHRRSNKRNKSGFYKDRRSGKDRRKIQEKKYFLKGGQERRSGAERRFLWYMTM